MKKTIKSSINLTVANIVFALSQWLLMLFIVRFLGVRSAGEYSAVMMVVTPIYLFFSFHGRHVVSTLDRLKHSKFMIYFNFRNISMVIAFVLSMLSGIVFVVFNSSIGFEYILLLSIFSLSKVFDGKSDILYGFFQNKNLLNLYAKSIFIKGIAIIILPLFVMYISKNLIYVFIAILVIYYMMYLYDKNNYEKNTLKIDQNNIFRFKKANIILLHSLIFMGLGAVLDSLIINSQRYVILAKGNLDILGSYSPIVQLILIAQIIILSIGSVLIPKLSKQYNLNSRIFIKYSLILTTISLLLGALLIIIFEFYGKELVSIFFGQKFTVDNELLFSISISGSMLYLSTATQYILISQKKFKLVWISSFFALLSIIPLTMYLFDIYGSVGAGYALFIAFFIKSAIQTYLILRNIYA